MPQRTSDVSQQWLNHTAEQLVQRLGMQRRLQTIFRLHRHTVCPEAPSLQVCRPVTD
jgi:hypothetical protein